MRFSPDLEAFRVQIPPYVSVPGDTYGIFEIPYKTVLLLVMACDASEEAPVSAAAWEHASVSLPNRCPTWEEMCFVKSLFWDEDETVMQFHPRRCEHMSTQSYCLHLWKKFGVNHELPPKELV